VRDLIYAGRLPSVRLGRRHFIKTTDLDLERRRRLGLPLRHSTPRTSHRAAQRIASLRPRGDPALRRQRAAERAELVRRWAQRHQHTSEPQLPFVVLGVTMPVTCEICGREVRRGRIVELAVQDDSPATRVCTRCGRRAVLDWADRRRQEAAAARRLAESLGQPEIISTQASVA
jgi:hypothetical protein